MARDENGTTNSNGFTDRSLLYAKVTGSFMLTTRCKHLQGEPIRTWRATFWRGRFLWRGAGQTLQQGFPHAVEAIGLVHRRVDAKIQKARSIRVSAYPGARSL